MDAKTAYEKYKDKIEEAYEYDAARMDGDSTEIPNDIRMQFRNDARVYLSNKEMILKYPQVFNVDMDVVADADNIETDVSEIDVKELLQLQAPKKDKLFFVFDDYDNLSKQGIIAFLDENSDIFDYEYTTEYVVRFKDETAFYLSYYWLEDSSSDGDNEGGTSQEFDSDDVNLDDFIGLWNKNHA